MKELHLIILILTPVHLGLMDFHASTYTPGSRLDDDKIENDNVHINTGGIINNGNEWNLSYRNIDTLAEYDPDGRWNTGDPGSYERKQEILYGNFKQNIKDDKLSLNYSLSHKKLDLLFILTILPELIIQVIINY